MNANSHSDPYTDSIPDIPLAADAWQDLLSVPEIQVYTRRVNSDVDEDESHDDVSLALHIAADSMPSHSQDGTLLDDDTDDLCTSFVEDMFEPPQATLVGRIVFGSVATVCLLALLAMALFHIWAHGQATRLGFTYSQIKKEQTRLKEEHRLLKLQLAKLRNPMRLARIARQQLGMRLPDRGQVISEEQVNAQLQAMRQLAKTRKGVRIASNKSQGLMIR